MKAVSEIVGRAELAGGGSAQVYRALRSLLCSTCGAEIGEGTLFTRRKVKGIGVRIMPQCRKCAPFAPAEGGGKKQSDLLRSLLAAPEKTSQPQAAEKNLKEEVASRLGPALRRGRKGRQ